LGWSAKNVDGRIDDPNAGWKGKATFPPPPDGFGAAGRSARAIMSLRRAAHLAR
jgi:hypothetical protein